MEREKYGNMEREKCEERNVRRRGRSGGEQRTSLAENQLDVKMVDVIIRAGGRSDVAVRHCLSSHFYTNTLCVCVCVRECFSAKCRGWKGWWVKSFWLPPWHSHCSSLISFIPRLHFYPPPPAHLLTTKTTVLKMLPLEQKYAGMFSDAKLDFSIGFMAVTDDRDSFLFFAKLLQRANHNHRMRKRGVSFQIFGTTPKNGTISWYFLVNSVNVHHLFKVKSKRKSFYWLFILDTVWWKGAVRGQTMGD